MRPRRIPSRLFVRVYLSFCMALIAAALAFWVVNLILRQDPVSVRWATISGGSLAICGKSATETYRQKGPREADIYLSEIAAATRLELTLFDPSVRPVAGHLPPSPASVHLAHFASRNIQLSPLDLNGAFPIRDPVTGSMYVLTAQIPGGLAFNLLLPGLRALAALAIAALICYAVTRSVTDPVLALRTGAMRLAGGDLSARVGNMPSLLGRSDEIADLGHDFDIMASRLETAMLAQRRLLADISHELRSPLARMGVALELARLRGTGNASPIAPLDRIEREAARMNELIEELLTLARLDSGVTEDSATSPISDTVDLNLLVCETVCDADFEAQAAGRGCAVTAFPNEPILLRNADRELLRRAIENVVRNASRYTAPGTIAVVTMRVIESDVSITVRDYGLGVPEESLEDLFRPFWRVGESRERTTGGVGLGLAIAERAIRRHAGSIHAENCEPGLIVTITLPISPSHGKNVPVSRIA